MDARGAARAYRVVLARLIRAFKPFISPSVFLVDSSGRCAANVSVDELAETRRCGLDQDHEFPPLPTEARLRLPELTAEFERHYREYRTTVVLPLFRHLVKASTLVILVDVPAMLLAGPRRFVDERQVVLDLVDAVQDDGFGARLLSFLGMGPALERVAFVAAKADLVAVEDRSSVEWLEAFGRFQAVLDGVAARRVRSYAIRVGLGTAASRFAVLDQVIVFSACLALLKELLSLYGLRPSALQTGVLLARTVVTTYLSGVVHDFSGDVADAATGGADGAGGADDNGIFEDLVGKLGAGAGEAVGAAGVLAPLAGRAAEAAVNGLLVSRLGTSAVRLVQPIRRS